MTRIKEIQFASSMQPNLDLIATTGEGGVLTIRDTGDAFYIIYDTVDAGSVRVSKRRVSRIVHFEEKERPQYS